MKKFNLIIMMGFYLLLASCSSSDSGEGEMPVIVIEPPIEEVDPPVTSVNPTEGFSLGSLALPQGIGVPPLSENWELVDSHSDDFNYTGKGTEFAAKWNDTYFNSWDGPGLTQWRSEESNVADGNLIISASRSTLTERGIPKVDCGVVTSKEQIKFPIYSEVRAKVANQVLSSNFWFLSPDDKREIDILEIYGGDRADQAWFAARPSTNTHVFVRGPSNEILQDINKQQHHTLPGEIPWRNDYHTFGVYWKDAFTLDYYYDGVLVSEVREGDIADPEGLGIDRDSYMIIDLEDHEWRSFPTNGNDPTRATDAELANESKNKYFVDYVRTYRPVAAFDGGLIKNGSFDAPSLEDWFWKGSVSINTTVDDNNGDAYTLKLGAQGSSIQEIAVEKNSNYKLDWKSKNTNGTATVSIHEIDNASVTLATGTTWNDETLTFNSGDKDKIYVVLKNTGSSDVLLDAFKMIKQ